MPVWNAEHVKKTVPMTPFLLTQELDALTQLSQECGTTQGRSAAAAMTQPEDAAETGELT